MNTIICAEIIGPFNNNQTYYDNKPIYIELPNTVNDFSKNKIKLNSYTQNKYSLLKEINIIVEDEQPIPQGVFIISSIIIMDEDMVNVHDSQFAGHNVINIDNKLQFYSKQNVSPPRHRYSYNSENMFCTPDGIGFYAY